MEVERAVAAILGRAHLDRRPIDPHALAEALGYGVARMPRRVPFSVLTRPGWVLFREHRDPRREADRLLVGVVDLELARTFGTPRFLLWDVALELAVPTSSCRDADLASLRVIQPHVSKLLLVRARARVRRG